MLKNRAENENVIFWGAGATQALGIRTTHQQGQFIRSITGVADLSASLEDRAAKALANSNTDPWRTAVIDLLRILGDGDNAYESISDISDAQFDAMRRNSGMGASDKEIRRRIVDLRLTYDWPALKSVVRVCPGSATDEFKLNDLFNLLDMHIPSGFGFRGPAGGGSPASVNRSPQFFDARRLAGAKNALLMLLITLFYVDYQVCVASRGAVLQQYKDVAILLARRMQKKGLRLARDGVDLPTPVFYQGDVGFVSLNYDPILFWVQFVANRELNRSDKVPHIGSPAVPLYLFSDFGHLIPSRRIGKGEADSPWHPMNEAIAQRLNEVKTGGDHKVRPTKILFPHGCLCWRECPDCGKLSSYLGDQWDLAAVDLLLPPPLLAFRRSACPDRVSDRERDQRAKGMIDARSCLHCGTLNFANHTQVVMRFFGCPD
jgi:hypothetical protein